MGAVVIGSAYFESSYAHRHEKSRPVSIRWFKRCVLLKRKKAASKAKMRKPQSTLESKSRNVIV